MPEAKKPITKTKPVKPAKTPSSVPKPSMNDGDVLLKYDFKVITSEGQQISLVGEVTAPFILTTAGLQNARTHLDQLFTILVEQPLKSQFMTLVGAEMEKAFPRETASDASLPPKITPMRAALPAPEVSGEAEGVIITPVK